MVKRSRVGYYTVGEASEALGWSRYSGSQVERLIQSGDLPYEKFDGLNRRWIRIEAVEAVLWQQAGVRDAAQARDRIASLQAEVGDLRAASDKRMEAAEALQVLSLDESLALLQRLEFKSWAVRERERVEAAERYLQQQIYERDNPQFTGKRPPRVPRHAKRRTIATAIGEVDIWYWTTRHHRWLSTHGGPEPSTVSYKGGSETAGEAIKWAGSLARFVYGKPNRRASARLRFDALERSGFACVYCGRRPPDVVLHVDHVVPVAKGGSNEIHNLVAACRDCNLGKHARELQPAEPVTT